MCLLYVERQSWNLQGLKCIPKPITWVDPTEACLPRLFIANRPLFFAGRILFGQVAFNSDKIYVTPPREE
jgi:hypothetical protein